jgi:hypothetical protein
VCGETVHAVRQEGISMLVAKGEEENIAVM